MQQQYSQVSLNECNVAYSSMLWGRRHRKCMQTWHLRFGTGQDQSTDVHFPGLLYGKSKYNNNALPLQHTQPSNGNHESIHHCPKGQNIKGCDYGTLEDSLLKDCLVAGACNMALRNKLVQTVDLTLTKYMDICELSEFNSKQLETEHDRSQHKR